MRVKLSEMSCIRQLSGWTVINVNSLSFCEAPFLIAFPKKENILIAVISGWDRGGGF